MKNLKFKQFLFSSFILLSFSSFSFADDGVLNSPKSLKTETGNEVSLMLSSYNYSEPNLGVTIKANQVGIEYERTQKINEDIFLKGDLLYNYGTNTSYNGSGVQNNVPNYYYEIRGLVGHDFDSENYVISPYLGLGYRFLSNDDRGQTSTGAAGYRREISYLYIPLGLIHRFNIDETSKLESKVEYDYLIQGKVNSYVSDTIGYNNITYYPDVTNTQTSGFGIRLSTSYQFDNFSITPYLNYWFVQNSDILYGYAIIGGTKYSGGVFEPTNRTNEYGIKVSYKF